MGPGEDGDGAVAQRALENSNVLDETLLYGICHVLRTLYVGRSTLSRQRYTLKDEVLSDWLEAKNSQLETERIPLPSGVVVCECLQGEEGTGCHKSARSNHPGSVGLQNQNCFD